MVDGALRWILRHEKRVWIVITLTFLTGLLLILPAVEEYSAAKTRMQEVRIKLEEANRQLQSLPQLQRLFAAKRQEVQGLEAKAVGSREVELLYAKLQQLIRETGCEMRRLDFSEPHSRPWLSNDSPTRRIPAAELGHETPFQLVSRKAVLRMEGAMPNVYQFLTKVSQLERFIHAKQIRLERSPRDENSTELEMHFEMFDLVRKNAA